MSPALELFFHNFGWMGWNLFLAIIPLGLSFILFVVGSDRNPTRNSSDRLSRNSRLNLWWRVSWGLGMIPFILFLPNAAYIVTDIIHFVSDARDLEVTQNGLIFIIIPQYIVFLLLGFQCHVWSLINFGYFLRRKNIVKQLIVVELFLNLLCAWGVYLGRFNRLNSWYLFTKPDRLFEDVINNLDRGHFVFGTMLFFIVITLLYYPFKWVNLSIMSKWRLMKQN